MSFQNSIIAKMHFTPAWWLPGPHLQTLWGALIRPNHSRRISLVRERIELSDGDFVDLDWAGEGDKPIVIMLHGLEGSAQSGYAQGLLKTLVRDHAWRAVVMHFRSCSGEPNRLPRFYHSGDTADLAAIVQILKEREPHTPVAAIGVSMGANVLLKWLGETSASNRLVAAVAVSTPFDLSQSVLRLKQGFSRVYDRHFLKRLYQKMQLKFTKQLSPIKLPTRDMLQTISDFDEHVTAPLHGFQGADDYYRQSSCRQFINTIRVPTLLLHAKDDPFMFAETIPLASELPDAVVLEVSDRGGHVGFVMGRFPWKPVYWLEHRIPLFLKNFL
jgi:predicted alpha/beta-fold hydrolase